jgi:hypothetical protein
MPLSSSVEQVQRIIAFACHAGYADRAVVSIALAVAAMGCSSSNEKAPEHRDTSSAASHAPQTVGIKQNVQQSSQDSGTGGTGSGTRTPSTDSSPHLATSAPNRSETPLTKVLQRADPRFDRWDTEVLNEIVGQHLHHVGELLSNFPAEMPTTLENWVADDARI